MTSEPDDWFQVWLAQCADGCSDPLPHDEAWWQSWTEAVRTAPAWQAPGEDTSAMKG